MLDLDARHARVGAQAHGQRVQAGAVARAHGDEADLRDAEPGRPGARLRGERGRADARAGRRPGGERDEQAAGLRRLGMSGGRDDEPERKQDEGPSHRGAGR